MELNEDFTIWTLWTLARTQHKICCYNNIQLIELNNLLMNTTWVRCTHKAATMLFQVTKCKSKYNASDFVTSPLKWHGTGDRSPPSCSTSVPVCVDAHIAKYSQAIAQCGTHFIIIHLNIYIIIACLLNRHHVSV